MRLEEGRIGWMGNEEYMWNGECGNGCSTGRLWECAIMFCQHRTSGGSPARGALCLLGMPTRMGIPIGMPSGSAGQNPGDPATRRPGDPATRRSGDPATRRSGDPATRRQVGGSREREEDEEDDEDEAGDEEGEGPNESAAPLPPAAPRR